MFKVSILKIPENDKRVTDFIKNRSRVLKPKTKALSSYIIDFVRFWVRFYIIKRYKDVNIHKHKQIASDNF
jgi:uncharacterized protein YutD